MKRVDSTLTLLSNVLVILNEKLDHESWKLQAACTKRVPETEGYIYVGDGCLKYFVFDLP